MPNPAAPLGAARASRLGTGNRRTYLRGEQGPGEFLLHLRDAGEQTVPAEEGDTVKEPASPACTLQPRPPNPSYRNPARTAAARPGLYRPDRPRAVALWPRTAWLAQRETPHGQ